MLCTVCLVRTVHNTGLFSSIITSKNLFPPNFLSNGTMPKLGTPWEPFLSAFSHLHAPFFPRRVWAHCGRILGNKFEPGRSRVAVKLQSEPKKATDGAEDQTISAKSSCGLRLLSSSSLALVDHVFQQDARLRDRKHESENGQEDVYVAGRVPPPDPGDDVGATFAN